MSTEEKALSKPLNEAPAYLTQLMQGNESLAGAGLDKVRSKDIVLPRATLMQALSPKVAKEGKFKAGDIVHNIDDTLLAEPGARIKIVVIKHFLQWIAWKDREVNNGGILESSYDESGALAKKFERGENSWQQVDENGNPVTKQKKGEGTVPAMVTLVEYHNFVVFMPEILGTSPILISCGKTNWKHGKNLCSRMKNRGGIPIVQNGVKRMVPAPAFAGLYTVRSENEDNSAGQTYKVFKFDNAGWADDEIVMAAASAYESFKDAKISTEMDEEPAASAAAPTDL